jgi:hypothetical protein
MKTTINIRKFTAEQSLNEDEARMKGAVTKVLEFADKILKVHAKA